jgi:hypothetical protein
MPANVPLPILTPPTIINVEEWLALLRQKFWHSGASGTCHIVMLQPVKLFNAWAWFEQVAFLRPSDENHILHACVMDAVPLHRQAI